MRRALPADELSALDWALPEGYRRTPGGVLVPDGPSCGLPGAPRQRKRKAAAPAPSWHAISLYTTQAFTGIWNWSGTHNYCVVVAINASGNNITASGWTRHGYDGGGNRAIGVFGRPTAGETATAGSQFSGGDMQVGWLFDNVDLAEPFGDINFDVVGNPGGNFTFGGLSLTETGNHSWVILAGMSRAAPGDTVIDSANISGAVRRQNGGFSVNSRTYATWDTNGPVSSWGSKSISDGSNNSAMVSVAFELRAYYGV